MERLRHFDVQRRTPEERSLYGRFTVFYAERDGGPVLKGQHSWRKIDGFQFQTKRYWFAFSLRAGV